MSVYYVFFSSWVEKSYIIRILFILVSGIFVLSKGVSMKARQETDRR